MVAELAKGYLASSGDLAATTRTTYEHALRAFAVYLNESKIEQDPRALPVDVLVSFKQWLHERYKPRTVKGYLTAANNLLRWLDGNEQFGDDTLYPRIMRRQEANKTRAHNGGYVARPIDPAIAKLITHYVNTPLPKKKAGRLMVLRNRVLVAFLYDTAARVSEAMALTRADVADGRADSVILYKTKGDKPRTVFISEQTQNLIREYVAEREDRSAAPLFVSHARDHGKALSTHQAWMIVKDAAKAEGLLDSTSPHCLRHKRAQDLLDEGMPLEWITVLLGHESPGTTKNVYAPHVNTHMLRGMLKQYGTEPLDTK